MIQFLHGIRSLGKRTADLGQDGSGGEAADPGIGISDHLHQGQALVIMRDRLAQGAPQPLDAIGIGHHTCDHYYWLVVSDEHPTRKRSRLTAVTRLALPQSEWASVAARVAAGEPLRAVARAYGISHECVRRINEALSVQVGAALT
jgi:hypothetical protein